MPGWPDASTLVAFLARVQRRLAALAALRGAAAGLVAAAAILLAGRPLRWPLPAALASSVGAVLLAGAVAWWRARESTPGAAARVERAAPECRNVVITAAEVLARPERVRDYVGARVCRDAADRVNRLQPAALFPLARPLFLFGGAATLAGLALVVATRSAGAVAATPVNVNAAAIRSIEIVVSPPAYRAEAPLTLRDPPRLAAVEGSEVQVTVSADAAAVSLETLGGPATMSPATAGTFRASLAADRDGFLAVQAHTPDGRAGARQLIPLTVTRDPGPSVRITAPGRDLVFPDGKRTIDVTIEAEDDLALDSLRLIYTKASGSGENFDFVNGEVPVTLTKRSDRQWTAAATWPLAALELEPGAFVVYRGAATDRRPGAAAVESDALLIEIAAPGEVASEGFAIDDQRDRYAYSQQMVILKTERLIAQQSTMLAADAAEEAHDIAALQRAVRAEFVFMMGGEVEDEEVEAAGESELREGRLVNRGRTDLLIAIRSMSRAAGALTQVELKTALEHERQALTALQQAFSRSRYILRTLTTRERIDFERRLTGLLSGIARDQQPASRADATPEQVQLRGLLAEVSRIAARDRLDASDAAALSRAAERLLRLPAATDETRAAAALLSGAAAVMTEGNVSAGDRLQQAAKALTALAGATLPGSPAVAATPEAGRLGGALADAQRKRGGR